MTAALDAAVAYHLGMVVHDLDATAKRYSRLLRVPRWHTQENEIARIGFGRGAGLTFELIQPRTSGTLWANFLETRGEGLQHIGFWVPDIQEAVAEAVAEGAVVTLAVLQGDRAAVMLTPGESTPDLVRRINPRGFDYVDIGFGGVQFEFAGPNMYDRLLKDIVHGDAGTLMALPSWAPS